MIENKIYQDNLALTSLGGELKNTLDTTKELHKEFRLLANKVDSTVKDNASLDDPQLSKLTKDLKESTIKITVPSNSIDEIIKIKRFHEKLADVEFLAATCESYQEVKDALENLKNESKDFTNSKEFEQMNESSNENLKELKQEIDSIKVWLSTNNVVTEDLELADNIMTKALSIINRIETSNKPASSMFNFKQRAS